MKLFGRFLPSLSSILRVTVAGPVFELSGNYEITEGRCEILYRAWPGGASSGSRIVNNTRVASDNSFANVTSKSTTTSPASSRTEAVDGTTPAGAASLAASMTISPSEVKGKFNPLVKCSSPSFTLSKVWCRQSLPSRLKSTIRRQVLEWFHRRCPGGLISVELSSHPFEPSESG